MQRLLARLVVFGFVAGCFGEGPQPTGPTGAQVVFYVPPVHSTGSCTSATYIGDVAIGGTDGYAVLLPWTPPNNCGSVNTGNIDLQVMKFAKGGGGSMMLATLGKSGSNGTPRLGANADRAVWAYTDNSGTGGGMMLLGGDPAISAVLAGSGTYQPTGVIVDTSAVYVGGWPGAQSPEPNIPSYPCCGSGGPPGGSNYETWRVQGGSATPLGVLPSFACDSTTQCFTGNVTDVFYVEHAATSGSVTVGRFPKAGGSAAMVNTTMIPSSRVPVGLAADDAHVAWATSINWKNQGGSTPEPPACRIAVADLPTGSERPLLDTGTFSCMGLALDAAYVYFTIVTVPDSSGGQLYGMRGVGLGRVSIADKTVETLRLGSDVQSAGPRRLFSDGEDLYAVDPTVIARIPKSALSGQHDFE